MHSRRESQPSHHHSQEKTGILATLSKSPAGTWSIVANATTLSFSPVERRLLHKCFYLAGLGPRRAAFATAFSD
jgi:hypothetical protein